MSSSRNNTVMPADTDISHVKVSKNNPCLEGLVSLGGDKEASCALFSTAHIHCAKTCMYALSHRSKAPMTTYEACLSAELSETSRGLQIGSH